jgi:hypothetical protein
VLDGAPLHSRSCVSHPNVNRLGIGEQVSTAMAVGAHQIALLSLIQVALQCARERAEPELLLGPIAMMELESGKTCAVAAVRASPAEIGDESLFPRQPMLLLPAVRLRIAFASALFDEGWAVLDAGRRLRRVVDAEGRALQAEAPSIQIAELSVDDLSRREGLAARFAGLDGDGASYPPSRLVERTEWATVEATLPAA